MSVIESDKTWWLRDTEALLLKQYDQKSTFKDRQELREICQAISDRSAKFVGTYIFTLIRKMNNYEQSGLIGAAAQTKGSSHNLAGLAMVKPPGGLAANSPRTNGLKPSGGSSAELASMALQGAASSHPLKAITNFVFDFMYGYHEYSPEEADVTVAVDGSVYNLYPDYKNKLNMVLYTLTHASRKWHPKEKDLTSLKICVTPACDDGSGVGAAAILACRTSP